MVLIQNNNTLTLKHTQKVTGEAEYIDFGVISELDLLITVSYVVENQVELMKVTTTCLKTFLELDHYKISITKAFKSFKNLQKVSIFPLYSESSEKTSAIITNPKNTTLYMIDICPDSKKMLSHKKIQMKYKVELSVFHNKFTDYVIVFDDEGSTFRVYNRNFTLSKDFGLYEGEVITSCCFINSSQILLFLNTRIILFDFEYFSILSSELNTNSSIVTSSLHIPELNLLCLGDEEGSLKTYNYILTSSELDLTLISKLKMNEGKNDSIDQILLFNESILVSNKGNILILNELCQKNSAISKFSFPFKGKVQKLELHSDLVLALNGNSIKIMN